MIRSCVLPVVGSVMEILLSSVSTRQLLIGKVFGLGFAGLLQMIFWLLSALLMVRLGSSTVGGFFDTIQVPDNLILLGIVCWWGFALYTYIRWDYFLPIEERSAEEMAIDDEPKPSAE